MHKSIGVLVIIISLILLMNCEKKYTYAIYFTQNDPDLEADWEFADWKSIPAVHISNFRPENTTHKPLTSVKLQFCLILRMEKRVMEIGTQITKGVI
ncbi:hypothetical protein GF337_16840 [candidate division KSB1 bacterium]|nr:hypothetical protein [candidate division KSB1 bacterium]